MPSSVWVVDTRERGITSGFNLIWEGIEQQLNVSDQSRIVIKPNLSWPYKDKAYASNTSPELIEVVLSKLSYTGATIVLGESDGTRYTADEAMRNSEYDVLVERYDVEWQNFSNSKQKSSGIARLEENDFLLPSAVLNCDLLVNLPVLKTHALTVFTGAVKNLWGCIPRFDRIYLHRYLDEILASLAANLNPSLNIMDAGWCMEGRGPVNGKPRFIGAVLASLDPVALDATAMRLVGLEPTEARHLALASEAGAGEISSDCIEIIGDFESLATSFEPARLESAVAAMNYLTRYRLFTYKILLNDQIFTIGKKTVNWLRNKGLI